MNLLLVESSKENAKNIHFNWSTVYGPLVPLFDGPVFHISFRHRLQLIMIDILIRTWLFFVLLFWLLRDC